MSKGFNRGYQAGYNDGVAAKDPKQARDGQNARVTATYMKGDNTVTGYADMTSDLPADELGELITTVLNTAWSKGEDPAGAVMVLQFGSVPEGCKHEWRNSQTEQNPFYRCWKCGVIRAKGINDV